MRHLIAYPVDYKHYETVQGLYVNNSDAIRRARELEKSGNYKHIVLREVGKQTYYYHKHVNGRIVSVDDETD